MLLTEILLRIAMNGIAASSPTTASWHRLVIELYMWMNAGVTTPILLVPALNAMWDIWNRMLMIAVVVNSLATYLSTMLR